MYIQFNGKKDNSNKITSGNVRPSITEVNPNRFPTLVLVSIAISIHLFSIWTLSSFSGVVRIVIATNNFIHSVLEGKTERKRKKKRKTIEELLVYLWITINYKNKNNSFFLLSHEKFTKIFIKVAMYKIFMWYIFK